MPPKTTFAREDVVNAAFEIVREKGFRELTSRRIAERIGASTAPVYSCFSSMDELKREIMRRAEALMLEYARTRYTASVFLNMGTGLTLFARDNRELFHSMFLENSDARELVKSFFKSLEAEAEKDDLIAALPASKRVEVFNRMAMFTHGFASLICVGLIRAADKNFIIKTMYEMGRDVIDYAMFKSQKNIQGGIESTP